MFGFRGGESPDTVARKKGYRHDAQRRWTFLTHYDLSTVGNEAQLSSLVSERSGISKAEAASAVHAWAQGKRF